MEKTYADRILALEDNINERIPSIWGAIVELENRIRALEEFNREGST